jgi:hypothetical protein
MIATGRDRLMFDTTTGGHTFEDGEKCPVCGISRKTFDDSRRRCAGRSPSNHEYRKEYRTSSKREQLRIDDWE